MLRFKDDVRIGENVSAQLVLGLVIADQIYTHSGRPECWVTSISDGVHKDGSKHYQGRAADLRTRDLGPNQKAAIFVRLAGRLRPLGFDVIDEGDHFHIEFDPAA